MTQDMKVYIVEMYELGMRTPWAQWTCIIFPKECELSFFMCLKPLRWNNCPKSLNIWTAWQTRVEILKHSIRIDQSNRIGSACFLPILFFFNLYVNEVKSQYAPCQIIYFLFSCSFFYLYQTKFQDKCDLSHSMYHHAIYWFLFSLYFFVLDFLLSMFIRSLFLCICICCICQSSLFKYSCRFSSCS